jgi:hypothetical protein
VERSRSTVLAGTVTVVLAAALAAPAGPSTAHETSTAARGSAIGRYVVLLSADPVAAYSGGLRDLRATSPRAGRSVDADAPRVRRYARFLRHQQSRAIRAADVERGDVTTRYTFAANGFAAELTRDEAVALRRQPRVLKVVKDRMHQIQTDNSPQFLGLTGNDGPWEANPEIKGEGVVMGVIDTGIWPEHPSFADDGTFASRPRLLNGPVPCEFGARRHNPDDARFACNNKLLGARDMRITYKQIIGPETYNSARDDDGHGTHTASTAAGNEAVAADIFGIDRGEVSGIAPRARIVAYKACGEQGCVESDLMAAIDTAVADGVDVINYSIGGGAGLFGPDEAAFFAASDAGVFAATSAGNDGPGAATVGGPSTAPWVTSVGASTQDRAFEGAVELGDGTSFTGASITEGTDGALPLVDAAALGNELCLVGGFPANALDGAVVLCKRGENARVDKSLAVAEAGGAGMVLYDVSDAAALVTDNHWVPSVHISNSDGLAVKDYIAAEGAAATATLVEGERVPAQGSVMADFSSRGPNAAAPDIIKPDITAPGVNILAGNTPTPVLGRPGQLFQSISGTSMSSPHIAGVYALLKQVHADWTPAMAKSAIMTTARQDVVEEDGATPTDPFDDGAGHVRPGATGPGSIFDPGLVYDAGTEDYLRFMCGADPSIFVDPDGACAALTAGGQSTDASDLNYPSIGVSEVAGRETVTRTVTSVATTAGATTYAASVDAPAGFEVTVSPQTLTLAPGETATFEVTIANAGRAPLGEWRFGSLTWSGGAYEVRSPIAAAASAFDAPELVEGTGASGRARFAVQFGYSGRYAARGNGLAARQVTAGEVGQDPDQTFDPNSSAGTTAHRFRVNDTAYMRWELTHPNQAVDLDVYLYNRAGEEVASSTSGGTDELIELRLPADGVYTMYVHGWQTVAEPRESYRLRHWQVAEARGGSLQVVEAPTAAELGANGPVVIRWTGAPAGAASFGAVTHHQGRRALGLTVVRVAP